MLRTQSRKRTRSLECLSRSRVSLGCVRADKSPFNHSQSIPVVQETLDRVLAIIKGNSLLAALYARGEQLTQVFYAHTKNLVNPVLSTADIVCPVP